jgi:hypothetical protein
MSRDRIGSGLLLVAGLGFLITAGLHLTGFDSVLRLVSDVPDDLKALGPALWLSFSLDYVVLGLVLLAAWLGATPSRLVVAAVAIAPIGAAWLQVQFLGFIPPTVILIVLGVLTFAAAGLLNPQPEGVGRPAA